MNEPTIKYCPRCAQPFECNAGNIHLCQCRNIVFTRDEQKQLGAQFEDCLCRKCLLEMQIHLRNDNAP